MAWFIHTDTKYSVIYRDCTVPLSQGLVHLISAAEKQSDLPKIDYEGQSLPHKI